MQKPPIFDEQDPRLQSKCTTPKQIDRLQTSLFERTKQKSHIQFPSSSPNLICEDNIEKVFEEKIKNYEVISKTLTEYMRQQKMKSKAKTLNTSIEIMKAFTKTHIKEVSPNVTQLIKNMLDTLSTKKKKKPRTAIDSFPEKVKTLKEH